MNGRRRFAHARTRVPGPAGPRGLQTFILLPPHGGAGPGPRARGPVTFQRF